MHELQTDETDANYITLTQAAKISPGRPTPNCIWRWARRGVLARNGQRIKLEHARLGGRVFTKECWVREFGRKLAEADAVYFERANGSGDASTTDGPSHDVARQAHLAQVEDELRKAGI